MTTPTDPAPAPDAEWDGDPATRPIVRDLPDDLREAKAQLDALAAEVRCEAPAPGPDTPRWTIDDDGDLVIGSGAYGSRSVVHGHGGVTQHGYAYFENREDFALLVADVRAARVHEGCAHTTDTLQQAREKATRLRETEIDHNDGKWMSRYVGLLDLLVDGGGDV